jgi:hypothetical protein
MSRDQFNPNWPAPAEITRQRPERDMVNLSRLDSAAKRAAFERMRREDPGLADFISRMHKTFGRSELFVDQATAERLGVKGGKS